MSFDLKQYTKMESSAGHSTSTTSSPTSQPVPATTTLSDQYNFYSSDFYSIEPLTPVCGAFIVSQPQQTVNDQTDAIGQYPEHLHNFLPIYPAHYLVNINIDESACQPAVTSLITSTLAVINSDNSQNDGNFNNNFLDSLNLNHNQSNINSSNGYPQIYRNHAYQSHQITGAQQQPQQYTAASSVNRTEISSSTCNTQSSLARCVNHEDEPDTLDNQNVSKRKADQRPVLSNVIKKKSKDIRTHWPCCSVCGEAKNSGLHYGAFCCEACKMFFK